MGDTPSGGAGVEGGRGAEVGVEPDADTGLDAAYGAQIWSQVVESVRGDGRMQEVLHWISYAEPVHRTSGRLIVAAPNAFIRDRILQGQPDAMLEIARRADPELQSIEIIVDTRLHPPAPELPRRSAANLSPWPSAFFDPHSARPRMRFDRFVPGRSNVHAVRAAEHLAEAPEPKYHSVFIHGDIGYRENPYSTRDCASFPGMSSRPNRTEQNVGRILGGIRSGLQGIAGPGVSGSLLPGGPARDR